PAVIASLLELVGNLVELRVQVVTQCAGANHDRQSNESGDEAVLNGGRAGFVLYKTRKQLRHCRNPSLHWLQHFRQLLRRLIGYRPIYGQAVALRLRNTLTETLNKDELKTG